MLKSPNECSKHLLRASKVSDPPNSRVFWRVVCSRECPDFSVILFKEFLASLCWTGGIRVSGSERRGIWLLLTTGVRSESASSWSCLPARSSRSSATRPGGNSWPVSTRGAIRLAWSPQS